MKNRFFSMLKNTKKIEMTCWHRLRGLSQSPSLYKHLEVLQRTVKDKIPSEVQFSG